MSNLSGRAGNGWSPMRYIPPPALYQATRTKALGEVSPSSTLLDSPLLSFTTDVVATGASAWLAYEINRKAKDQGLKGSGWSTFWWILSAMAGIKALHDLARMNP